jgi:beta-lactam-binding protein with PASTA domain
MSFLRLITKKQFWKIVVYGVSVYIILFAIVFFGLKIYTKHGKSFPVPDFNGLTLQSAIEVADSRDLIIEIIDSTFVPYLPKGSVIDQYPKSGINVKADRTIFLTINAFNQAKVKMPNIVGVSYRQGKATLESRGLKVGKLIYRPDFAKNNILNQKFKGKDIPAGTMIEKGQHVDLILGNGLSRTTTKIPNLIKYTYTRAVSEINDAYFNVGVVTFDSSVKNYNDTMNALVWKQRPMYSDKNKGVMGGKLDIWLTLDESRFVEE